MSRATRLSSGAEVRRGMVPLVICMGLNLRYNENGPTVEGALRLPRLRIILKSRMSGNVSEPMPMLVKGAPWHVVDTWDLLLVSFEPQLTSCVMVLNLSVFLR